MAYRTWGRVLLAALGAGIVTGAGQLGIAYGLGLVRFNRTFDGATANHWPGQLVWVGWFAMVAAVLGAVLADRLARRYDLPATLAPRAAISAAAALGALAVAPLSMQPARAAQVASADPVTLTGVAATLGAAIGLGAALATLSQRPIGWNIGAVTGTVWFLAVLSVLPSLGPTDPLPAVRIGGVDPNWLSAGTSQRLAVVTMPALALVAGALTGALARWWRGLPVPVVATCGVAGPAMLALAYVVAGKGESTDAYQAAPYWGALIAVGTGALGSVLAATARWPLTSAGPAETGEPDAETAGPDHAGPAGIGGPLQTGTAERGVPVSAVGADPPTVTLPASIPIDDAPTAPLPTGTIPPGDVSASTSSAPPGVRSSRSSEASDAPAEGSPPPGFPDGWSGARRLRTEDFWPTTTPTTPPATTPAPTTTPPATRRATGDAPVADHPVAGEPPAGTRWSSRIDETSPGTPARTDDGWDAFSPVSRTEQTRPVPVVAGGDPTGATAGRATTPAEPEPTTPVQTEPDTPVETESERGSRAKSEPESRAAPTGGSTTEAKTETKTKAKTETETKAKTETETGTGVETGEPGRSTGRIRRGLFRRDRSSSAEAEQTGGADPDRTESRQRESKSRNRTDEPLPARDEEYVDWVSGLSEPDPAADDLGRDGGTRRSLRSTGRHQAD